MGGNRSRFGCCRADTETGEVFASVAKVLKGRGFARMDPLHSESSCALDGRGSGHAWPAGRRAAKRRTALTLSILEQFLDGQRRLRENGGQKALGTLGGMSYRWHMEKITEYTLVGAFPADLNSKVNEKIGEGYQPFGSPFVLTVRPGSPGVSASQQLCQAMVKYR